jgi:phosphatidylinositol dimannoside acyltransferase
MTPAERAASAAYQIGWLVVRRIPEPCARWMFEQIADASWRLHGRGVQQLEANLRRVEPDATSTRLRELSRAGMRSYLRYWMEAFRLPVTPRERIVSGMNVTGEMGTAVAQLQTGRGVIFALPHMANVDVGAAWLTTRGVGRICVVVERLRPESLFRQFMAYRESLGLEVIPHSGGPSPFGVMARRLRAGQVVCIVADRDLSTGGIEVSLFGENARVGAGPATLAVHTGAALMPVTMWFEGRGWRAHVYPEIPVPADGTRAQNVAAMTQQLATVWQGAIAEHPQDWHMLQKVFAADLDAAPLPSGRRHARAAARRWGWLTPRIVREKNDGGPPGAAGGLGTAGYGYAPGYLNKRCPGAYLVRYGRT